MSPIRSMTADKIIVDRRKAHRNTDVARAVRKSRERLSQRAGNPVYDREMLALHAQTMVSSAIAVPLLIIAVTVSGVVAGFGIDILIWATVAAIFYTILGLYARKVASIPTADIRVSTTTRNFLIVHTLAGLSWAFLAMLECDACGINNYSIVVAVILLIAIAATAIVAAAVHGALICAFVVPVGAYAWFSADYSDPVNVIMVALVTGALPFFAFVSSHLNRSALMMMSFRSEKDGLIAELETAKSMSDEARRRAEEANLAKSRFLASMSHELRTPLNAILGFSEVIAGEVLGPIDNKAYKEYARDINVSGNHLLNLINEILDLSRIEAGRYDLKEEAVTIPFVVEDCCHMVALKLRTKNITIKQNFEDNLPRIWADERAVRQITLNLLSNAVKFTPVGGEISISVGWTTGGGQYISVRDNGPGIPEDEIPVVLSAFGQGSIAIKNAEQGAGLGLPIVQALLDKHGGSFKLQSKLREGTMATAIFPASRVLSENVDLERTA